MDMKLSIDLFKNMDEFLTELSKEKHTNQIRPIKYFRSYQYPDECVLVTLDNFDKLHINPLIPLLFKFVFESFIGFKNGKEIISQANSPNDWGVLLKEHMNPDKIIVCDKVDVDLLNFVFNMFNIREAPVEVMQLIDDDFLGFWWYGYTRDFVFLVKYIKYI